MSNYFLINKSMNDKFDQRVQLILFRRRVMTVVNFSLAGRKLTDDSGNSIPGNHNTHLPSRRSQGVVKHHW